MSTIPSLPPNPISPITIPFDIRFWLAFRYWLLLDFINFGGPAGQMAMMHRDLVDRHSWISEPQFLHALKICMLLPGPEAQQLSIYIGWLLHGTWGGIVAGVCFVLPSIFVLLALSYGGAYAVLAYVSQSATDFYGWLTHGQMMDGFALAETTPGPLIMVLQFVGFMAGWNQAGNFGQVSSAVLAALLTTYSTFLPCFLFIFLGAPYIELLRGNRDLSGALSAITAAVVGVVMNLAIVLGFSVFWPHGLEGAFNGMALTISIAAFVALYRLKVNILWVLLIGGLLGLGLTLGTV